MELWENLTGVNAFKGLNTLESPVSVIFLGVIVNPASSGVWQTSH